MTNAVQTVKQMMNNAKANRLTINRMTPKCLAADWPGDSPSLALAILDVRNFERPIG